MILFLFFCSLVTKEDLRSQYPDAEDLIDYLPAASWTGCFKPEAHLLIEKFLSLKKGESRNIYYSNMINHTRIRHEVSSIFFLKKRSSEERLLTINLQFHFFSPVP